MEYSQIEKPRFVVVMDSLLVEHHSTCSGWFFVSGVFSHADFRAGVDCDMCRWRGLCWLGCAAAGEAAVAAAQVATCN